MAKRVGQLYDALSVIAAEVEQLMPQQYRQRLLQSTNDPLGQLWDRAVNTLVNADDYLYDLLYELKRKAEKADERAAAAVPEDASPLT
jgi:hypothetical protein